MKTWGGRFDEPPDQLAADFGRSIEIDAVLATDDIEGSRAHVRGLRRAGVIDEGEETALIDGLAALAEAADAGTLDVDPDLEDIHMNLEAALEKRVGPVARKLHTGRSRNDQVSTDLRLWLRRNLAALDERLLGFERSIVSVAQRNSTVVMPGTTHTQPAQPVLFAHHLLAYVEMMERDRGRFADAGRRANVAPLGSGAIAGAGFPLDREQTAADLGFAGVTHNSIDASGDRDFVIETLAAAALTMAHLSRLAEEIVWWSNPQFGYVRLADAFSTGSSMLPNKRNPDPAELIRGRTAKVIGELTAGLTLIKGLPLGYQRDLQEDKPLLFDAVAVVDGSLRVLAAAIETMTVNGERMREAAASGHVVATAVADTLVGEGVAFRSAHHVVGQLVRAAESAGAALADLTDDAFRTALSHSDDERARALAGDTGIGSRLRASATIEGALARCDVVGGTAPERVAAELLAARSRLAMAE